MRETLRRPRKEPERVEIEEWMLMLMLMVWMSFGWGGFCYVRRFSEHTDERGLPATRCKVLLHVAP